MSFYIISEDELKVLKEVNSNTLSRTEWEMILEHKDLFLKFIKKCQLDAQLWLAQWQFEGKEDTIRSGIKGLQWVSDWIDAIEKAFEDYDKKMKSLEKKAE